MSSEGSSRAAASTAHSACEHYFGSGGWRDSGRKVPRLGQSMGILVERKRAPARTCGLCGSGVDGVDRLCH